MTRTVALVRGEALNAFEFQSYSRISGDYRVVAVGSTDGTCDVAELGADTVLLRPKAAGRVGRRLYGDRARRLRGLARAVGSAEVVHSAETFLPISEQIAELRARDDFKFVLTCWETIPFLHEDDSVIAKRKQVVREAVDLFLPTTELARTALLLENVPEHKVRVQPVGIDREVFRRGATIDALRSDWGVGRDAPVILYCGRLIREKGVISLVLALEEVADAILVVAGVGPERSRLEAAARARKVADRVRFVGSFRYRDMPAVYAEADLFCLPSLATPYWEEQFGMVLAEAMSCGVPIVATETGAIPEVVGDAGVLVPPADPRRLAAAIKHVLGKQDVRAGLATAGERRVAERYDALSVADSLRGQYDALLA